MSGFLSVSRQLGLVLSIPLFLIFFMLLMALPAWVVDGTSDPSWFALYEYHFDQRYQWGIDTIETVGPLGFLHYADMYSGILHTQKVVFQAIFAGLLSFLILSTCRLFGNTLFKVLWLVFAFLGLSSETEMLSTEVFPYLAMLLIAHHVFLSPSSRWTVARNGLFIFCLAFLVLMKTTTVLPSIFLVIAFVVQQALSRKYVSALINPLLFSGSLALLWVCAHQRLTHLPAYFAGILSYTSGYTEAVSIYEPLRTTALGVAICLMLLTPIIYRLDNWKSYRGTLGLDAFTALCIFVAWKHGYVRADIHVYMFLGIAMASAALILLADEQLRLDAGISPPTRLFSIEAFQVVKRISYVTVIVLCWAGLWLQFGLSPLTKFQHAVEVISQRVRALQDYPAYMAGLNAQLASNRTALALTDFKKIVGDASVSYTGCRPSAMLLTGFNYQSEPMPISYAAFNRDLLEKNAAFYRDARRRPEFVVCHIESIDRRLAPLDDSLAKLELLYRYKPIASEKGALLLKRIPCDSDVVRIPLGPESRFRFGQPVPVPSVKDGMLWVSIDVHYTSLGKLVSLLYKPPYIAIALSTNKTSCRVAKFIPSLGKVGFLLNPMIVKADDWAQAYHKSKSKFLTSSPGIWAFKLLFANDRGLMYLKEPFSVTFFIIPEPRAMSDPDNVPQI